MHPRPANRCRTTAAADNNAYPAGSLVLSAPRHSQHRARPTAWPDPSYVVVRVFLFCACQDRVVLRGSDDFYPREEHSHGPHLYTNAFNALLLSNLGIQDWDMFQTGLGLEARTKERTYDNAVCRAGHRAIVAST